MTSDLIARVAAVLSPAAKTLLETLLAHATASADGADVVLAFPHEERTLQIIACEEGQRESARGFDRFLSVCGGMRFGEQGSVEQVTLHDGYEGTLACIGDDLFSAEAWGLSSCEDVCAPIDIGLDMFYFFHPVDDRVCLQDGSSAEVVCDTADIVEVYLREIHAQLKDLSCSDAFHAAFANARHRSEWLQPFAA
ncbi:MAG: hypothetical protein KC503_14970 [Myxococcales bacterium]|nr:hypothetical protein [Myxococcales bacterium]